MELLRAGDDKSLDSHHTTGLTATFSGTQHTHFIVCTIILRLSVPTDVSSFASMRHHSNLGFETSSAQRSFIASYIYLGMHCPWIPL